MRAVVALISITLTGCMCQPSPLLDETFSCAQNADCRKGFHCAEDFVCRADGAGGAGGGASGGGAGGGTGGGTSGGAGGGAAGGSGGGGGQSGGGAGGGSAGGSGGSGGGGMDPLAERVAWPGVLPSGVEQACLGPVHVEHRVDGGVAPVIAHLPLRFAVSTPGITLSDTSTCASGFSFDGGRAIAAGDSAVDFWFFGDAGTYTLSVGASGMLGDFDTFTLTPLSLPFLSLGSVPIVRAGECSGAVSVDLRNASGMLTAAAAPLTVTLSSFPLGLQFFSDAACTVATSQVTIPQGNTGTLVAFKTVTGLTYQVSGTSPQAQALSAQVRVRPAVRRLRCPLLNNVATCQLPIAAQKEFDRTAVIAQMSSNATTVLSSTANCDLRDILQVECHRFDGGTGTVETLVQTLEMPTLHVSRVTATCPTAATSLNVPHDAGLPSQVVTLMSAMQNATDLAPNQWWSVELLSAFTASLQSNSPCAQGEFKLQFLRWPGVTTYPVNTSIAALGLTNTSQLFESFDPSTVMLLSTSRWTATGATSQKQCAQMVRTRHGPGNDQVTASRGVNDAACAIAPLDTVNQRIYVGSEALVQSVDVQLANGVSNGLSTIAPVDATRTVVFASTQGPAGQSLGETDLPGPSSGNSVLGSASGIFDLGVMQGSSFVPFIGATYAPDGGVLADRIQTHRNSVQGAARWTVFVVQVNP